MNGTLVVFLSMLLFTLLALLSYRYTVRTEHRDPFFSISTALFSITAVILLAAWLARVF